MKRLFIAITLVVSIAWLGLASIQPSVKASFIDTNWAQWRGPEGQGISPEKGLPLEWSETKNVQWKTPIPGRAHSSPIVWGNRIFLTTAIEGEIIPGAKAVTHYDNGQVFLHPDSMSGNRKQTFRVLCLDRDSGKILWDQMAYEGRVYDDRHRKSSYAAPTPVTDGQYVYAWFGSEGLYCYDFTGKQVWKKSLGPIATVGMGVGTSPILHENLLILQCDEDNGEKSFITALDKKTGNEVWKQPRKVGATFSTPIIVRTPARAELITNGAELVISYDPATGKELWRCKGVGDTTVNTPVTGQGVVVVSVGNQTKQAFAIRLGGSGDLTDTKDILWKHEKGTAYVPSSIIYGDYFYLMSDRGLITCFELKTGQIVYQGGRIPVPASFTASPVAFDGKILLCSEDGDTFILKAGPKHEIIASNTLGEPIYASPAIAGGKLFIRSEKSLYCISNQTAPAGRKDAK